MKIMSNEQLVVSYRDALKSGSEKEWVWILKKEIVNFPTLNMINDELLWYDGNCRQ